MASRKIDDLHPLLAYAWGKAEAQWGHLYPDAPTPFLICTNRPAAEQDALYAQPRDKRDNDGDGKIDEADEFVTNARGGQSPHNYLPSMAFDIAFKDKAGKLDYTPKWFEQFALLVLLTKGITWGGTFLVLKDRPHFEVTGWKNFVKPQ